MNNVDIKQKQRENWNDLAASWSRWSELFEEGVYPITQELLTLSGVSQGDVVLDIASGTGDLSAALAERVGETGRIVGVDISEQMTNIAKKQFADIKALEFVAGDAVEFLSDKQYSHIVSRFGVMFFPDLPDLFDRCRKALNPGGTLTFSVWGWPDDVPVISLAFGMIARALELAPPPPNSPTPFCLSNIAKTKQLLKECQFNTVYVNEVIAKHSFKSTEQFVEYVKDTLPGFIKEKLKSSLNQEEQGRLWMSISQKANEYHDSTYTVLNSKAICISASI